MKLPVIAALMLVWFASLFVLRIIPKAPLAPDPPHRALGAPAGLGAQVRPERGAGLAEAARPQGSADRGRRPPAAGGAGALDRGRRRRRQRRTRPATAPRRPERGDPRPRLRRRHRRGAAGPAAAPHRRARAASRSAESSELDAGISLYLFSDQPVAVRLKKMRQLLSAGVSAHELRTLEDLRDDLAQDVAEGLGRGARQRAPAGAQRQGPWPGRQGPRLRRPPAAERQARLITIRSGSIVTSTCRWPAQCSE